MNNKFQTISRTAALTLVLVCGPFAANAAPVLGGPDGHYYEVIVANGIDWSSANTAAMGSSHLGVPGHLATLTSQAENDFVDSLRQPLLGDNETAGGGYISAAKAEAWIGGFQTPGCSPEPGCGWTWVNGEGAIPGVNPFVNWHGGEPNDSGNDEDQIVLGRYLDGTWNDSRVANGNIGGYIIEYDTVAPVANNDPGNMANSGETIQIDVLANDMLFGQDVTSLNITSPSANGGTAVVVACVVPATSAFCVNYTSAPGFGQQDSFKYTVNSGDLESNEATVTIDVNGSVSVTQAGPNKIIFGGPANGSPLKASGEFANDTTESSVRCCSVRDPRVGLGNTKKEGPTAFLWVPFDIGAAMSDPVLSDCPLDFPKPNPGELIVARHFGVHTEDPNSQIPADHRFAVCHVHTDDVWEGPVHLDITAEGIPGIGTGGGDPNDPGYSVNCKLGQGVEKQPLTIGLTVSPPEYTAPDMRAVTVECDPRGVAKWSWWFFIPNAQHLTAKETSNTYVGRMSSVLKDLIEAMRVDAEFEGPAASDTLLSQVKSDVLDAEALFKAKKATAMDAQAALPILDMATIIALTPAPGSPDYPGNLEFPNPKGELVSHLMALRYAVCSELANPNMPGDCKVDEDVLLKLPGLLGE